ncbi:MAG TPA: glycosyltransferase family 4 protein [Caldilineaceae bacterium]|nr:glycosyltransferase family 4 protein [Caldilineaceae bacterium]
MLENKTILSISPFVVKPFLHGSITRVYHINRYLAQHNRLIFVYRDEGGSLIPDFPSLPIPNSTPRVGQIFSPLLIRKVKKIVNEQSVDFILANHLWSGLHALAFRSLLNVPLIFDNHNVEYVRFQKMGSPLWPGIWLFERLISRKAYIMQCVSDLDKMKLQKSMGLSSHRIRVIENGVDVDKFMNWRTNTIAVRQELGLGPSDALILFYGSLSYTPNQEAARILIQEIAPRLERMGVQGEILIAGNGDLSIEPPSISTSLKFRRLGFVPDLHGYIQSADLIAAPLMAGSGTRLKILESVASERPVVTTSIGAEGLDLAACAPFLTIRDDWDSFAEAIYVTLNRSTGRLSHDFIVKYDWGNIVKRMGT